MLTRWLLTHQLKEAIRSSVFQKNLVINILVGLFALYMVVNLLVAGFLIDRIMEQVFPETDPVTAFNGLLLYYFGLDLFSRFFLQKIPVLSIQPYLHLPVRRTSIIHFLLLKSVFKLFNILPLFIFVPFSYKVMGGTIEAATWLAGIVCIIMANNYLITYVKRHLSDHPLTAGVFAILFALFLSLDVNDIFGLSEVSSYLFGLLIEYPATVVVSFAILLTLYQLNFVILKMNLQLDIMQAEIRSKSTLMNFALLSRFGQIGELIMLEMKLILRHKRPKSVALFSVLFLFYGLIFYQSPNLQDSTFILIFVGIVVTGAFMISYGQFSYSWESSFFDGILSNRISLETYIKAKVWIYIITVSICYIVTLPYAFMGTEIALINTCAFLFNAGINSFMILLVTSFKPKRLELNKGSAFNFQGVGIAQYILSIPIFLLPICLYIPFAIAGLNQAGVIFIGLVGFMGLIMQDVLVKLLVARIKAKKYVLAAGFRQG
jgi:hypothetical protein